MIHFLWNKITREVCFKLLTRRVQPEKLESGKFGWDPIQQNIIHSSFFWGYILTELPGGRLAELIGGHRVFGHSMLWASLLTLFTPAAAFIDYKAVVVIRAFLGLMLGTYSFAYEICRLCVRHMRDSVTMQSEKHCNRLLVFSHSHTLYRDCRQTFTHCASVHSIETIAKWNSGVCVLFSS